MLDERPEARVGAEEVLPDVGAAGDRELLELPVDGLVHLVDEHTVDVTGEGLIPLATPDDLDDVPAGAAEQALELLDDLAVAADGSVEALEVAVDDEDEVVEPLASGKAETGEGLRLVHLSVAEEGPDALLARVLDATIGGIAIEARLVDGGQGPEAHADRRELPEVGHEPW